MIRKKKKNGEVYALHKHISMSAHKARRIINWIPRGCYYDDALMILEFMPYRGSYTIFKLIYSATANAKHNRGFHKGDLVISKVEVNEGPTRKKFKPRARGRSYLIKRPTCHITIVVEDITYDEEYERYKKYAIL